MTIQNGSLSNYIPRNSKLWQISFPEYSRNISYSTAAGEFTFVAELLMLFWCKRQLLLLLLLLFLLLLLSSPRPFVFVTSQTAARSQKGQGSPSYTIFGIVGIRFMALSEDY
jgi:hypothetical protein